MLKVNSPPLAVRTVTVSEALVAGSQRCCTPSDDQRAQVAAVGAGGPVDATSHQLALDRIGHRLRQRRVELVEAGDQQRRDRVLALAVMRDRRQRRGRHILAQTDRVGANVVRLDEALPDFLLCRIDADIAAGHVRAAVGEEIGDVVAARQPAGIVEGLAGAVERGVVVGVAARLQPRQRRARLRDRHPAGPALAGLAGEGHQAAPSRRPGRRSCRSASRSRRSRSAAGSGRRCRRGCSSSRTHPA